MNLTLNALGWLIMLIGISISIALHEVGHLVTAKRFGVKVTQYMVGFGPTLWSRVRGETEYGLKAVPLGGYIRMIGMFPPAKGDPENMVRASTTGRIGALVEDARQSSALEVAPEDSDRVFYKLPVRQKIVVMLGGPTMNFIIATLLFTVALVGIGTPVASNLVGAVAQCVPTEASIKANTPTAECTGASAPSVLAGLQAGDRIVEFGGVATPSWTELRDQIRATPVGPVSMVVERDSTTVNLSADLVSAPRGQFNDKDELTGFAPGSYFGMIPQEELQRQPVSAVPVQMWSITKAATAAIATLPIKMWELSQTVFGSQPRDPNGLVGVVGVGRISGEVVAAEGIEVQLKVLQIVGLLAGLNLFLFLFNLIPLLPLDGGHVVGALWEGIKRRWARMTNRPDPGPVDVAKALPLAYGISIVLVVMGALLVWADLFEPITLGL